MQNVYGSLYCASTCPSQRVEKLFGPISGCGCPVPQLKFTVGSRRVAMRPLKLLAGSTTAGFDPGTATPPLSKYTPSTPVPVPGFASAIVVPAAVFEGPDMPAGLTARSWYS